MQQETTTGDIHDRHEQLANRSKPAVPLLTNGPNKNRIKCAGRYQAQVGSKFQKKPVKPLSNKYHQSGCKITRTKNPSLVPTAIFKNPPSPECRKSLSMIDLSPARKYSEKINPRLPDTLARMNQRMGKMAPKHVMWTNPETQVEEERVADVFTRAAHLVCHALAVNAWRRRREEVIELRGTIEQLSQQVDHTQLQIVVLRRLLDTENSRVGKLGTEVHRAKTQLEKALKENDELRAAKNRVENEMKEAKDVSAERAVASENLTNQLLSVKCQLESLDAQIARDRDKLLKLREDKKILLEKVAAHDGITHEYMDRANKAEKLAEDLQNRLGVQMGIINTLEDLKQQLMRNLRAGQVEKIKLEKRLTSSQELGKALSQRAINAEKLLADRDAALRRIESAYNAQLIELNDLKERLARQSRDIGWSSRVLQLAGSVVRAPRAILRTLSFLSPSGEPSHP